MKWNSTIFSLLVIQYYIESLLKKCSQPVYIELVFLEQNFQPWSNKAPFHLAEKFALFPSSLLIYFVLIFPDSLRGI